MQLIKQGCGAILVCAVITFPLRTKRTGCAVSGCSMTFSHSRTAQTLAQNARNPFNSAAAPLLLLALATGPSPFIAHAEVSHDSYQRRADSGRILGSHS